jgi:GNAT superfamily N-acetyltransferase
MSSPQNSAALQVETCSFADVKPFASKASRERVKVDNPAGTAYYCVRNGSGSIAGFAALMLRGSAARLKGDFVLPEYRRRGIAKLLMAARLEECDRRFIARATAFCTEMSLPLYLANGFRAVSVSAAGITFVERRS